VERESGKGRPLDGEGDLKWDLPLDDRDAAKKASCADNCPFSGDAVHQGAIAVQPTAGGEGVRDVLVAPGERLVKKRFETATAAKD